MARIPPPAPTSPESSVLTRAAVLLVTAFFGLVGCGDEGTGLGYDYYDPDSNPGAAGAIYRPLRPAVGPGASGASGVEAPGLNTGGAGGAPGGGGAGGNRGLGYAGSVGSEVNYGSSGSAGGYGF